MILMLLGTANRDKLMYFHWLYSHFNTGKILKEYPLVGSERGIMFSFTFSASIAMFRQPVAVNTYKRYIFIWRNVEGQPRGGAHSLLLSCKLADSKAKFAAFDEIVLYIW